MTLRSRRFITLTCDEGGCHNRVKVEYSTTYAAKKAARDLGWSSHEDGEFCPTHNTKEPPRPDDYEHYKVVSAVVKELDIRKKR